VEPLREVDGLAPGELRSGRDGVSVGTGRGAVRLGQVQPAGKRMVPAADWARGARPAPGERLGE
jgi:methionyl-tRNA formyltransferase